jgi:superfamily II DNA or RNA helicase
MSRVPQRSYTPSALEFWFSRLSRDWEQGFSAEELEWGRRYYRTVDVRSTELLSDSAIVHFRQGKEAFYVIIDWKDEALSFRESHPGMAPGRGLGVAGLYELEELVADEVPAVAATGEVASAPAHGESQRAREHPLERTERKGRRLCVRFSPREDGLWLEAGWKNPGEPADFSTFSLRQLTRWEREQLIGFTARAHRCGFRECGWEGRYRLQDPVRVAHFIEQEHRQWKQHYHCEGDGTLGAWNRGVIEVQPVLDVRTQGEAGRYQLHFSHGGLRLPEGVRARMLKHPGHVHFAPGLGMFQVAEASLGSLQEWKALFPSGGEGIFPKYLIFSFCLDPSIRVNLSEEIARWQRELERQAIESTNGQLPDLLRGYQREGVAWLDRMQRAGCHGLLADEMGLGKTLQVLSLLASKGLPGDRPVLVVCPASVVPVWKREAELHFPQMPVRVLSRTDPLCAETPALWLASYTQLRRNKHLLEGITFAYAILDEAQSIKNPDAKVTHACYAIQADQRLALSGTPLENRPLDLWTLFRFLMPGFLGTRSVFEKRIKDPAAFLPRLRRQLEPFILRRTKDAVAKELPPKLELVCACSLSPLQRRLYGSYVDGAAEDIGGDMKTALADRRMHLFSLLTRLRQACCDPGILPGRNDAWEQSGKLENLVLRLEAAVAGGGKVVVFSQFVQFLRRARKAVRDAYPEVAQMELTGSTLNRERPVKAFREAGEAAVFFISLRAGGTGLNLQGADYVFLLDPWWNPAVEAQAIDRVHRIGTTQPVIVYRMITEGTIEERVEALKKRKGQLFKELLDDLEAPVDFIQHFESLNELIALREEGPQAPASPSSATTRV